MPNLSNIDEFANELNQLADEPEILRKTGGTIEEPSRPIEQGVEHTSPSGSEQMAPPEMEEALPPDIDQLLAGLGEEGLGYEEPSTEEPLPEETFAEAGPPEGVPDDEFPSEEFPLEEELGQAGIPEGESGMGDEDLPSDAFLDDLLRQSDQEEETEMTSIGEESESLPEDLVPSEDALSEEPGAAPDLLSDVEMLDTGDFGLDEPAEEAPLGEEAALPPAGELPDESIFFQVPSAEDLAPPEDFGEELPAEEPVEGFETSEEESFELPESPEGETEVPDLDLPDEASLEEFDQPEPEEPTEGSAAEEFEMPGGLELPDDLDFEMSEPPTDTGELETGSEIEESFGEVPEMAEPFPGEPSEEVPIEEADFDEPPSTGDFGEEDFELPSFDEEALGGEPIEEEPGVAEPLVSEMEEAEFAAPEPAESGELESGQFEAPEESLFEEPVFDISAGFEEPEAGATEEPAADEPGAPAEGAPSPSSGFDELGLGDIGQEFGLGGSEGQSEEELNPALAVGAAEGLPPEAAGEAVETTELSLSDRDFEKIQQTLSSLPRNLRIIIEELIGEQDLGGPQLRQLVNLLVGGAPPREIADATSKIIGRRIQIPDSYEKLTGLEFEEERATFAYRFRHNILPILRVFLAGAAALALIVFLGYRFVYSPIHAYTLYAAGYGRLKDNSFVAANQDFANASRVWEMKNWYYRYAEGYRGKKQYSFAAQKYDSLLKVWPGDRKGIFDYAAMESKTLGNYQKANQLLDIILNKNMWDRQGLLAAGDNFLAWGQEDPSKYEQARKDYAMLLQHYGTSNEVLFRMLRYFIYTDNLKQVEILKKQFQSDPKIKVDPLAYAELGGYLIDKGRLNDVHDILFRAMKVDPTLPEVHYNLARYFQKIGDYGQESVALQKALTYLQQASPLTRRRLGMLVDTYDRIGENLYRNKSYLDAEQAYLKGINRYETALKQNQLKPSAEFGKLYANLGDLNYYISGNFDQALSLYQKAENNGYKTPDLRYREGYVYYRNQSYQNALMKLYDAAGTFSDNKNLLYATANTLFKRNDYFAAEGYYINLLNILEAQRRAITTFEPNVIPAHHDLLVDLMKVYNNLGVTLDALSKRSSDPTKYSQALVNLTHSMEAFDQLTRNPITKEKSQAINLAFINMKDVLYPTPNYQLQIYSDLPQDMKSASF